MNSPSILILTTYPHAQPRHGGQLRTANIARTYRGAGFHVQAISVYEEEAYAAVADPDHDVPFPRESPYRLYRGKAVPFIADLQSGKFAAGDNDTYRRILSRVREPVRAIHVEQPWLLPLAERLLAEPGMRAASLIYGSQNVEYELKEAILAPYGIPEAAAVVAEIRTLEARACRRADLVLAVSDTDLHVMQAFGARRCLLARNGISENVVSERTVAAWRPKLPKNPFALYVGSAHPPNITGYFEMIGPSLAFLPPDRTLVIAGGVGPCIVGQPQFERWREVNRSRIHILGILDDEPLAAVKAIAHAYVLPIRDGSGSNIKTAEALQSGKHVLGTPVSFRGFETLSATLDGVYVEDSPALFRKTVTRMLEMPPLVADPAHAAVRASLLWENTLGQLSAAVGQLFEAEAVLPDA